MKQDMIPLLNYIIKLSNLSWLDVYFIWREQKLNLEPPARCADVHPAASPASGRQRCCKMLAAKLVRQSKKFKGNTVLFHTVGLLIWIKSLLCPITEGIYSAPSEPVGLRPAVSQALSTTPQDRDFNVSCAGTAIKYKLAEL